MEKGYTEGNPRNFKTFWNWITTSTIELTDKSKILGTCTRVSLSWNDYVENIIKFNQIDCKSFLFCKIFNLKSISIEIIDVIYMSINEQNPKFKIEFSDSEMINHYLKYLKEPKELNRYDLELAGMFLGGVSVMTFDGIYFRLSYLRSQ